MAANIKVKVTEVDGDTREIELAKGGKVKDIPGGANAGLVYVKEVGNGYTRGTLETTLRDGDEVLFQKAEGKFLS